ncbi:MAG: enoyl-CoA hydratase [Alphaproteobacteria bacterium]|nr:MAG: enoyl-CoA hydratase [Alphaproteobacteria bacterium]
MPDTVLSPSAAGTADNEDILLRSDDGPVSLLTLNHPQARNCLSEALLNALQEQIDSIAQSRTAKAVVIAANGPVFSSGHDIRELNAHRSDPDGGRSYFEKIFNISSRLMKSIVRCPKPVIAAVTGTATAAGSQLVATCDLAVASAEAEFCTPGVHIGLFCSTPMVALSRNVGRKRAMEMLLLGEMIGAEDAARYGLVNRVVPKEQVIPEAMEMARKIASKSSQTIAIGKATFYRQVEEPLGQAYDTAAEAMAANMMIADAEEGLCAFLEKREPHWSDS